MIRHLLHQEQEYLDRGRQANPLLHLKSKRLEDSATWELFLTRRMNQNHKQQLRVYSAEVEQPREHLEIQVHHQHLVTQNLLA
jgi:hypothetical protein